MNVNDEEVASRARRELMQRVHQLTQKQMAEYEERLNIVHAHLESFEHVLYQARACERRVDKWREYRWWHPLMAIFIITVVILGLIDLISSPVTYVLTGMLLILYLSVKLLIDTQTLLLLRIALKQVNAELKRYGDEAESILHAMAESNYAHANGEIIMTEAESTKNAMRDLKLRYVILRTVAGEKLYGPKELQEFECEKASILSPLYKRS